MAGWGALMDVQVAFFTYAAAAVAYAFLAILLAVGRDRREGGPGRWLIGACGAMAFWGLVNAGAFYVPAMAVSLESLSETVRTAGWVLFLGVILSHYWQDYGRPELDRAMRLAIGLGLSALLILDILLVLGNLGLMPVMGWVVHGVLFGRMAAAVGVVFMVDNFYRNTAPANRWGVRLLCLGLGAIFLYDFFFFAEAVLTATFNQSLYEARGLVNTLIVPLVAISAARNPHWKLDVSISRGVVVHSASLIGSGIYLIAMGAAGYYLHNLGGRWGTLLQVSFWFGAIVLLVVIVFSGQFRARMRVVINKNFFNYRYDYRAEWLRFISTVSASEMARGLQERVIQAIADIMDSPAGALWQRDETGVFVRTALWNFRLPVNGTLEADHSLIRFLVERGWIVDLRERRERPDLYDDCTVPDWLAGEKRAWLVVPLLHHGDELVGFVVLQAARAPRELNWEDHDILKTIGRQVASYLAEQMAEKALAEAQQFEEFNKRFAFIMHDLKNLVSQLSLMVKNADRHAGNPEFQRDMILTVKDSVDKIQQLLTRLNRLRESEQQGNAVPVDLVALLHKITARHAKAGTAASFAPPAGVMPVLADPGQLETVFGHLVQNAVEAAGANGMADGGKVDITLVQDGDFVVASVTDNGPGMDEAFVRDELFKPFRTTKQGGYGIGAYEARQLVRHCGGRIEVDSKVGQGTAIRVRLPVARTDAGLPSVVAMDA